MSPYSVSSPPSSLPKKTRAATARKLELEEQQTSCRIHCHAVHTPLPVLALLSGKDLAFVDKEETVGKDGSYLTTTKPVNDNHT